MVEQVFPYWEDKNWSCKSFRPWNGKRSYKFLPLLQMQGVQKSIANRSFLSDTNFSMFKNPWIFILIYKGVTEVDLLVWVEGNVYVCRK